jgi:hypothetical protein
LDQKSSCKLCKFGGRAPHGCELGETRQVIRRRVVQSKI